MLMIESLMYIHFSIILSIPLFISIIDFLKFFSACDYRTDYNIMTLYNKVDKKHYFALFLFLGAIVLYDYRSIVITFLMLFFLLVYFLSTYTKSKKLDYNEYFRFHKINLRILLFRFYLFIIFTIFFYIILGVQGILIGTIIQIYLNPFIMYISLKTSKIIDNIHVKKLEKMLYDSKATIVVIDDKDGYPSLAKTLLGKNDAFIYPVMQPNINHYELWLRELLNLTMHQTVTLVDVSKFKLRNVTPQGKIEFINNKKGLWKFELMIKDSSFRKQSYKYNINYMSNILTSVHTQQKLKFSNNLNLLTSNNKRSFGYLIGSLLLANDGILSSLHYLDEFKSAFGMGSVEKNENNIICDLRYSQDIISYLKRDFDCYNNVYLITQAYLTKETLNLLCKDINIKNFKIITYKPYYDTKNITILKNYYDIIDFDSFFDAVNFYKTHQSDQTNLLIIDRFIPDCNKQLFIKKNSKN